MLIFLRKHQVITSLAVFQLISGVTLPQICKKSHIFLGCLQHQANIRFVQLLEIVSPVICLKTVNNCKYIGATNFLCTYLFEKNISKEEIDPASDDIINLGLLSVSGSDSMSITELPVFVSFGHKLLQEWCGAYFIQKNLQKVGNRYFLRHSIARFVCTICTRRIRCSCEGPTSIP